MNSPVTDRHKQAAEFLSKHADYRVQRRLVPVAHFHVADTKTSSRIGVVIDVETTGLDRDTDRIIELAVQRFRFDDRGRIVQVGLPRVWREDPGIPIDPKITKLTGLAVDDIAGQASANDSRQALGMLDGRAGLARTWVRGAGPRVPRCAMRMVL
ncbi:exonuclease domain-containing protein [Sphingobium chlorophenolicum]|uniref:exonuclease domain-containing protein n=1 Tax=Sphingobium chlorophenolicum TaxID=46429 RepID=UPI001F1FCC2C|nr:exonuclease domain-containing protein [Sphingobium chlorophenolicum]